MLYSSGSYNTAKQNYPFSVASYNTRPGNEVGLYYNAPEPTRGGGIRHFNYKLYNLQWRPTQKASGTWFTFYTMHAQTTMQQHSSPSDCGFVRRAAHIVSPPLPIQPPTHGSAAFFFWCGFRFFFQQLNLLCDLHTARLRLRFKHIAQELLSIGLRFRQIFAAGGTLGSRRPDEDVSIGCSIVRRLCAAFSTSRSVVHFRVRIFCISNKGVLSLYSNIICNYTKNLTV